VIVRLLIDHGANVNAKAHYGATALMAAAQNGHLDVVKLLIAKEADVNARTRDNQTALSATQEGGHAEVARYLKEHGAK
jgi:ankyrin repeat protein